MDQILQAGWHLLKLINEILDLAPIESGKLSLSPEPISLTVVMRECEAMVEPQASKRGILVSFPALEADYFVNADRTRVKQILINPQSNAIKYNKPGGKVIVENVAVSRERISVCVEDTGAGLPPEKIAQLFQYFNRLGQEGNVEEGTCVGLVMTKRLAELMSGAIGVQSTVGRGSVFWAAMNVTRERQSDGPLDAADIVALPPGPVDKDIRTLLYVEDNPANRMLVESLMERRPGIRLPTAGEGWRGTELARKEQPDVILTDINLPWISGIKALKILEEDPVNGTHSRLRAQRQRHAARRCEEAGSGVLSLPDQTDQGQRVRGHAG